MDTTSQFTNSSDDDLLLLWVNKAELNPAAIQALQAELEKRQLARVVYTIAGLPKVELLRTPPISYQRQAPTKRTVRHGATRLLFTASGVLLIVVLRLSIPSMKDLNNLRPLVALLSGIVLIPLAVYFILSKAWKPFAPLITSMVAFATTAALCWYGIIGYQGSRQIHQRIEGSSAEFVNLQKKLDEDLGKCRVPEIPEMMVSPDKLTPENLADAESRIATARTLLEDYGNQYQERYQGILKTVQTVAEDSQAKNWNVLKDALLLESQWMGAKKKYFEQISEFVRYMKYYRHLYRVVNHRIVFSEADGRQTYEYYKNHIHEYSESQKKLDAALSTQIQQLISNISARTEGS